VNPKEAFNKLAILCSKKEYCISDMQKKMQYWKLNSKQETQIIAQLIDEKYIDEKRFTEAFVKDKFRFNKWGKYKISFQLKQKGINQELIESALEIITETDYFEIIEELLISKNKSIKAQTEYERRGKLLRFMAQRGFEIDAVNIKLDSLIDKLSD